MATWMWVKTSTSVARRLSPWLAASAALSTIIFSAYSFLPAPPTPFSRYKISLVCAVIVLLVAATVFATRFVVLKKNSTQEILDALASKNEFAELINSISQKSSNEDAKIFVILSEMYLVLSLDYEYCIFLRDNGKNLSYKEIQTRFDNYLSDFLGRVAAIFGVYTGNKCAACVKILSPSKDKPNNEFFINSSSEEEVPYVYTISRDPTSSYERNRAYSPSNLIYKIAENTALFEVKHVVEKNGYYSRNGLHNIDKDLYRNSNKRWKEFYDSVAVAALKAPTHDAVVQALGYLCVDNVGGGFDDRNGRIILECLANLLYYSIQSTFPILIFVQGVNDAQK